MRIRVAQTVLPKCRKDKSGDTPPAYPDDPHARTVADDGGHLRYVDLPKSFPKGKNGGCGSPTIMNGTSGGEVPCGSRVKMLDGTISDPVYCYFCEQTINQKPDTDSLQAAISEFTKKHPQLKRSDIEKIIGQLLKNNQGE